MSDDIEVYKNVLNSAHMGPVSVAKPPGPAGTSFSGRKRMNGTYGDFDSYNDLSAIGAVSPFGTAQAASRYPSSKNPRKDHSQKRSVMNFVSAVLNAADTIGGSLSAMPVFIDRLQMLRDAHDINGRSVPLSARINRGVAHLITLADLNRQLCAVNPTKEGGKSAHIIKNKLVSLVGVGFYDKTIVDADQQLRQVSVISAGQAERTLNIFGHVRIGDTVGFILKLVQRPASFTAVKGHVLSSCANGCKKVWQLVPHVTRDANCVDITDLYGTDDDGVARLGIFIPLGTVVVPGAFVAAARETVQTSGYEVVGVHSPMRVLVECVSGREAPV